MGEEYTGVKGKQGEGNRCDGGGEGDATREEAPWKCIFFMVSDGYIKVHFKYLTAESYFLSI